MGPEHIAFLQYRGDRSFKGAIFDSSHSALYCRLKLALYALKRIGDIASNTIAALPLYHIFALTLCLLTIPMGCADDANSQSPQHRRTGSMIKTCLSGISGVNTLFNALMMHPQFKTIDFTNYVLKCKQADSCI
jgi:acyl-CoA synthetase (AMP-forming)/AMP-acid ligase II